MKMTSKLKSGTIPITDMDNRIIEQFNSVGFGN